MIIIDFETYSPEPIDAGVVRYSKHPEADIICMAYKIDDAPTQIWTPPSKFPAELVRALLIGDHKLYAHNAFFDFNIWHNIGRRKYRQDMPALPLEWWVDTVALVNRYGFPTSLEKAGEVLNLPIQKQKSGTALIKKICVPTKDGRRPQMGYEYTQTEMAQFVAYCKDDVNATYHLVKALPSDTLAPKEYEIWLLTQKMNLLGLPIDAETADKIFMYIDGFTEDLVKTMPKLTNGMVQKPTQAKRIIEWCATQGLNLDNLQAGTVDQLMAQPDLPANIRKVMQLRQMLGRSSTAKYRKISEMIYDGRVHGNLQYHGAHTGRWAGRGLQLQNLPRAKVKDPEKYIQAFRNFESVEDPVNVAKALIRPMICAPDGRILIVADYSSIENRVLAYCADDQKTLELFKKNLDQYKDMAAFLFNTAYEAVTKDQRQLGKVIVLGCGFGMGGNKFQAVAQGWGVELSTAEATWAVDAYRSKYPKVKQLWYSARNAMVNALRSPGSVFKINHVATFKYAKDRNGTPWLIVMLCSGRSILYYKPFIDPEGGLGYHGINPYSKKFDKLRMTPGTCAQNIVQALARDCMAEGLLNVDERMPEIDLIGTVHDEALGETDEERGNEVTLAEFNKNLCDIPWAPGLPVKAEGYIAKRYRK